MVTGTPPPAALLCIPLSLIDRIGYSTRRSQQQISKICCAQMTERRKGHRLERALVFRNNWDNFERKTTSTMFPSTRLSAVTPICHHPWRKCLCRPLLLLHWRFVCGYTHMCLCCENHSKSIKREKTRSDTANPRLEILVTEIRTHACNWIWLNVSQDENCPRKLNTKCI